MDSLPDVETFRASRTSTKQSVKVTAASAADATALNRAQQHSINNNGLKKSRQHIKKTLNSLVLKPYDLRPFKKRAYLFLKRQRMCRVSGVADVHGRR